MELWTSVVCDFIAGEIYQRNEDAAVSIDCPLPPLSQY